MGAKLFAAMLPLLAGDDGGDNVSLAYTTTDKPDDALAHLYDHNEEAGSYTLRVTGLPEPDNSELPQLPEGFKDFGEVLKAAEDANTLVGRINELEAQLANANNGDTVQAELQRLKDIEAAVDATNVVTTGREDVLELVKDKFKPNEEGQLVNEEGQTLQAYLGAYLDARPHLMPPSHLPNMRSGNRTGAKMNANNPWSKKGWNMTEQGRILRTDATKARMLAAMAGHTL